MPRPGSATVRNRRLAAELRRLRESGDFTGDDVAERLGWSASKVSRLENARQAPRFADVRRLLDLYGVDGTYREQLLQLARDAVRRGWWEAFSDALPEQYASYIGLEIEAEEIWQWETQVIPGLLQTEAYAQSVEQRVPLDRGHSAQPRRRPGGGAAGAPVGAHPRGHPSGCRSSWMRRCCSGATATPP